MIITKSVSNGIKSGVELTVQLGKVMVPIYIIVVFLKHSGILEIISKWLEPLMKLIGLPGEAAYALVLGNVLNIYAALGAMSAIALDTKQVTIIAIMLLICHNIFIESAVIKGCGIKVGPFVAVRIIFALVGGITVNLLL